VCHHLDGSVGLSADDGPRPRLRRVDGYHHASLTHYHTVGHGQPAKVDQSIAVVAETEECVL
jgi:hypothetical protein